MLDEHALSLARRSTLDDSRGISDRSDVVRPDYIRADSELESRAAELADLFGKQHGAAVQPAYAGRAAERQESGDGLAVAGALGRKVRGDVDRAGRHPLHHSGTE